MADEQGEAPDAGEPASPKEGSSAGVNRRALIGGGAGVVAAGVVVAGVATDWFSGSTSSSPATEAPVTEAAQATSVPTIASPAGLPVQDTYVPPGAQSYTISVNGADRVVRATPDTMLLYVLRDQLNLRGPKFGCGLAECGACAVLSDGQQIRSCITPISSVGTSAITTLEGLAASYDGPTATGSGPVDGQDLHPLQQAWIDEQVPQCGYCQSGMIIQAADLLSHTPDPSDAEIKQAMDGHLCRCGTHFRIVRAIKRAAATMAGASGTRS